MTCKRCGGPVKLRTYWGGRPQRFCSNTCASYVHQVNARARKRREYFFKHPRCMICNNPLKRRGALTCSRQCALRRYSWFVKPAEARELGEAACLECHAIFEKAAHHQRFCSKYCGNKYRSREKRAA